MTRTTKKRRGASPFSLRERSIIEVRWCCDGKSMTDIAKELGRDKGSISRELGGAPRAGRGKYHADRSHQRALARIEKRGNTSKVKKNPALKNYIEEKLALGWSPEQVSIRLPVEFKRDASMRMSPEAIYQEVYRRVNRDGNGTVKKGEKDLRSFLPRRHKRRAKKGFRKAQKLERVGSLPSIECRPKAVERRKRIGDWEDDTLVSRQSTARIKNATERMSGVTLFGKTKNGTAESCDKVLIERLSVLPKSVRKTLTRDRGTENLRFKEVGRELGFDVYFAHAYASYERGTNENTNGLIRRFFPKKTDWSKVSDEDLTRAEYLINTRPRKRHGGLTPVEVFLKATGVAIYS